MLAQNKGRFLYEIRPDLFPEGYLTQAETLLWARHYEEQGRKSEARRR